VKTIYTDLEVVAMEDRLVGCRLSEEDVDEVSLRPESSENISVRQRSKRTYGFY